MYYIGASKGNKRMALGSTSIVSVFGRDLGPSEWERFPRTRGSNRKASNTVIAGRHSQRAGKVETLSRW
jgi:hypothetical protein